MSIDRALSIARHPSNYNTRNSEIFSRMDSAIPSGDSINPAPSNYSPTNKDGSFPMAKYLAVELAKEEDSEFPEYFHKAGEIIFDNELNLTQKISQLQRLCIHTDMPVSDLTFFEGMVRIAESDLARKNDEIPSQELEIQVGELPRGVFASGKLGEYQVPLFDLNSDGAINTKDADYNDGHGG